MLDVVATLLLSASYKNALVLFSLRPSVVTAAARPQGGSYVVDTLFIVAPINCAGFVFGL